MSSVFTKIRKNELAGYLLEDNGKEFAILDINPRQKWHTLVIPYVETDYIFDLTEEEYDSLWQYVKKISDNLKILSGAKRIAIFVEGIQVPHVHVHLVPINKEFDFTYRVDKSTFDFKDLVNEYKSKFIQ